MRGDVLDAASLPDAMSGVTTAYYLVHSMGSAGEFETEDRRAAQNFAEAARAAGVRRIIYLGGLGDERAGLSAHLRSRHEVGEVLRSSGVPLIEFRASVVIGAGSLSFELVRALVERLPVMVTPRWVEVATQPIAIGDLLAYLLAALDLPPGPSRIFEIGGSDRTSYGALMREYAAQRGLRRWILPVPVLTPRLSSLWLALVTPVHARVGRELIEGVRNPTVVNDPSALEAFAIRPRGFREAIAAAIRDEDARVAAAPGKRTAAAEAAGFAASLLLCFAAAGVGGLFTASSVFDWYPALAKPAWTPPDSVFAPVWSVLYFMMAISAWLVWRRDAAPARSGALVLFAVQLALNVGWSACFFGLRRPGLALVEIVLLLAAIVATIDAFRRVSRIAAVLLLPYLAWSAFATILNGAVWWLNRS